MGRSVKKVFRDIGEGAITGMGMGGPIGAIGGAAYSGISGKSPSDLLGGGGDGSDDSSSDAENQQDALGLQNINDLSQFMPDESQLAGQYSYGEDPYLMGYSAAGDAYADPESIAAQQRALENMQEWATGDLTEADKARQQYARMQENQNERANREAILQQAEARGMGGAGATLAAQMNSDQGRANRLSMEDLAMQQAAMERALQANAGAAELSSGMRGSSYGEAMGRGQAIDALNQWNTQTMNQSANDRRDIYNRQQDTNASAAQQAYQNQESQSALFTDQYNTDRTRTDDIAANEAEAEEEDKDRDINAASQVTGSYFSSQK